MSIQNNIDALKKDMPSNVNLIAVSKTKPMEDISEAYSVGIRDFGENKVQEMINKYDNLDKDIRWHFIGHLQRNKVKYLVSKVYLIHSLDSIELLKEIEKQYGKKGDVAKTLIQINIGDEKSKTGIKLNELDLLLKEVEKSNCVKVMGLMAIIPKGDENSCREYFRKMKNLFND
ncbi:MAG: YggS family pyridoxal phosphate-dependent enzyme, partial [Clostridiaceae bacterium]